MSDTLKLLMCSPFPLDRRLGAPKVLIELAEALASYDWDISLVDQGQMLETLNKWGIGISGTYEENLHHYLQKVSHQFDVVDYDHEYLPFARGDFAHSSLMVARSVLFGLHHRWVRIPRLHRGRDLLLDWFRSPRPPSISPERIERIEKSLREADLINVSNSRDLEEIQRHGLGAEKTCVFPYGFRPRGDRKDQAPVPRLPDTPRVAFVGSFDERKGGADFPSIFERISGEIPGVQMRLLGTAGVFRTAAEVKAFFPRRLRKHIEVIPIYDPEELPELLKDCSAGIFPSYLEGFAFAILEMMATGVPVVAYDAPGACDILDQYSLVPTGDREEMALRVIKWLKDPEKLTQARIAAKARSAFFNWDRIAKETDRVYREALRKHCLQREAV